MLALCAFLFLAVGQMPVQAGDVAQPAAVVQADAAAVQQPQSNAEIRQWYNDQVVVISALDAQWRAEGVSAEQRARRAQDIRHAARIKAREFMQSKQEMAELQARDMEKYGNPDGPTFDQLVQRAREGGLTDDSVYESIVASAGRTSADYNAKYGVKPQGGTQ